MFEDFWSQYPRRVAKRVAEKAWSRLSPAEQKAAIEALPEHVRYWRQTDRSAELIPHPSTWLNQGRWEDELPQVERRSVVNELTGAGNVVAGCFRRIG